MNRLGVWCGDRRHLLLASAISLGLMLLGFLGWVYWDSLKLDLLIVNGLVVDGTGATPFHADVAVRAGKIAGVSRWRYRLAEARTRIDAQGQVVSPGFIDVHTHVEANLPKTGLFKPANFLKQGVTTLITGNCGRSRLDVDQMFETLETQGTAINLATLVGHNTVRKAVMGDVARALSADEMRQMQQVVERAMAEGALGFSTGLAYTPGRFAKVDELVSLAKIAAAYDGLYVSHVRNEAHAGVEALREALKIGKQAGIAVQISHLKCSGRGQWQAMAERLRLLNEARAGGLQVYVDAYPYARSSTTTDILLPDWAVADRRAALRAAASNLLARQRLRADILNKLAQDGWRDLAFVRLVAGRPEWIGHTLAQVPQPAATMDQQLENLLAISLRGGAQAVFSDMSEEDVALALADPFCVFGSDSAVRDPDGNYLPHPRGSGTFPRIFKSNVRERSLLELSQAVRKASGQAAAIFGLVERGQLQVGYWADIMIFNPETIEDRADYEQPFAEPRGINHVTVNGSLVLQFGQFVSNSSAGMALRNAQVDSSALASR
jgi:N-acyl-D-amino-acid deacylase